MLDLKQIIDLLQSFGYAILKPDATKIPDGPRPIVSFYHSQLGISIDIDPNTLEIAPMSSQTLAFKIIKSAMNEGARRKVNQIRTALDLNKHC